MTEQNAGQNTALELVQLLKSKKLHIALAESCTGGLIAQMLTAVAGASEVFELGVVSYSERIKSKVINVQKATLAKYTVYSAETAQEMALGVLALADADLAVGVTGLAGPGGGTAEKTVGLVYIAVGNAENMQTNEFHFSGSRSEIRQKAAAAALRLAWEFAEKLP